MASTQLKTPMLAWGTEGIADDIARRVLLNNRVTLCLLVFSACLVPVVAAIAGGMSALVLSAVTALSLIGLMLAFLGHIIWARTVTVLSCTCLGWVFSGALGPASGALLWYLVAMMATFTLFHAREKRPLLSLLLLNLFVLFSDYFLGHGWHMVLVLPVASVSVLSSLLFIIAVLFMAFLVWALVSQDVAAYEAASAEKHKLQAVVTTLNDVIFEINQKGNIINVWAADDALLPISREMYETMAPEKILPPKLYQQFYDQIQAVFDSGQGARFEYQSPNNHRWYEATIELIQDGLSSADRRVSMSLHDISRERDARQRVYVQNQIVNHHLNAIIFTDMAGRIQFINAAASRIYAANESLIVGKVLTFADVEGGMGVLSILEFLKDQPSWRGDLKQYRMNGQIFTARLIAFKVFGEDERVTGVAWNCKDVTEIREAEHQLKLSERRFRSMAENAPGVVVEFFTDRNVRQWGFNYVSPKLREVFHMRQEALLVDNEAILRIIVEEDRPVFLESLHRAIECKDRWEFKVRVQLHDGNLLWMRGILTLIEDENEQLIFHGLLMDITKEQSYKDVLLAAKEAAESATQAKSEFLSIMSHEIRTPLNALIGLSHLLLLEDPRDDQIENLRTLKFSAESLLALINDILDFGKIEAGKVLLEEIPFNLRELVEGIVASMSYQAEDKGITLRCRIDQAIGDNFVGDPTRLAQIINNLLSNAIKFTPSGSVDVRVLWRGAEQGKTRLEFRVTDTGIGIAQDKQKQIFRFFSQADTSVTRQFGGTGLGLTITRSLLRLLGSDVYLRSKPGEGSTFYFELMLGTVSDSSQPAAPLALSAEDPDLRGNHILLVDDNRVNVLVAMKLLTKWGAEVDSADSGEAAYKMAQRTRYHMILMDIQMPGMDGYEATRAIRNLEDPLLRSVPIIALTATVLEEVMAKAAEVGLNGVLSKPIRPAELKKNLVKMLVAESAGSQKVES